LSRRDLVSFEGVQVHSGWLVFRVRDVRVLSLLFLDMLGIRHVLDNRLPIALPLSPSSSISREVVSCINSFVAVMPLDPRVL
jgi:hypothetical protein